MPPPQLSEHPNRATALMVLSVLLFSGNLLIIKGLTHDGAVSVFALNAVRGAIGVSCVWLLASAGRTPLLPLVRDPVLIARGVIGGTSLLMGYLATAKLPLGVATTLTLTYVLFGAIFAKWFLGEALGMRRAAILVVSFAGVPLLVRAETGVFVFGFWEGIALLGGVLAGVTVVLIRFLGRRYNSITIFGSQSLYGLVIVLPWISEMGMPDNLVAWSGMLAGGVLAAGGQLVMTAAYRSMPVARGAALQLMTPLIVTSGGIMLFGEAYSAWQVLGGGLVIGGAAAFQLMPKAPAEVSTVVSPSLAKEVAPDPRPS